MVGDEINYTEARQLAEGRLKLASEARAKAERRVRSVESESRSITDETSRIELDIEDALADGRAVQKLRDRRRKATERVEDLHADHQALVSHLERARSKERDAQLEVAVARRRELQAEGAALAREIRESLAKIEQAFERWRSLSKDDRSAKDIVRSIDPDEVATLPDFEYATAVDPNFEAAILNVIAESRRAEAQLSTRVVHVG